MLIKRELLRLFQTFVENYKEQGNRHQQIVDMQAICTRIVPILLEDFTSSPDCAKEPLVLRFLAAVVERLRVISGIPLFCRMAARS